MPSSRRGRSKLVGCSSRVLASILAIEHVVDEPEQVLLIIDDVERPGCRGKVLLAFRSAHSRAR
jgi:hypothetical protein